MVEMIVSLAIFTVVALVAVGALVKIMDANRKSLTLKTSINNLNFALESMAREMRMGRNYSCTGGMCNNPNANSYWELTFSSSKRDPTNTCNLKFGYKYVNADKTFYKAEKTDCSSNFSTSDFLPLISPDITITRADISVDNTYQPKVFLYIDGSSGIREKDKTAFSIQTTISQRLPK